MQHTTRQAVSFLLVLILCLGLFPVTALADTEDSIPVVDIEDAFRELDPMPYDDGILFDSGSFCLGKDFTSGPAMYWDPDNLGVRTAYAKLYKTGRISPLR